MRTHVLWLLVAELRKLIRPLVKLSYQRSEEHTSELQSRLHLVCRLLLEKKKKKAEVRQSVKAESLTDRRTVTARFYKSDNLRVIAAPLHRLITRACRHGSSSPVSSHADT